jgi:hypothetical protein
MQTTPSTRKPTVRTIGALALTVAAVSATGCLPKLDTRSPPVETAELAPEFALRDTGGTTHRLSEMIAGGPAVVVFYRGYW